MNKRIKDLANRSGFQDGVWAPSVTAIHIEAELDRFARLIVKECLESIKVWRDAKSDDMDKMPYWQGYKSGCDDSIVEIQQRFGISNE